ncbi:MAG: serine/threonine-protein phosphatase [Thermogutta sp.]|nr:serine/threonine-protein phosphatase [Thermogutta sp.]
MTASSHGNIWQHCLEYYAGTDVGLRRINNQDSYAVDLAPSVEAFHARGHLFLVADGMGAHAAGELASKVAAETIPLTYRKLRDLSPPEALREAVEEANRQIHLRGKSSDDFRGMGTTVSVLCLLPEGAYTAQVGDSRTYLCRKPRIEQLSYDHSLVWELRTLGNLPEGANLDYVPKNIITRSLGPNPTVQVDLEGPFPIEKGDTFLLCSDGLSGQVSDEELGQILTCLPPREAGPALIDLANLRGGPDNITLVIVEVLSPQCEAVAGSPPAGTRTGAERPAPSDANGPPRSGIRKWIPLSVGILGALFAAIGWGSMLIAGFVPQAFGPGIGFGPGIAFRLGIGLGIGGLMLLLAACALHFIASQARSGPIHGSRRGPRLGKGPYATADATPRRDFYDKLQIILQDQESAARKEGWDVPWERFQGLRERAEQAAASGDMAAAIADSCRAMSLIMSVARSLGSRKSTPPAGFYEGFEETH